MRKLLRYTLQLVEFSSAKLANPDVKISSSNAHDLLKAKWLSLYIKDGSRVLDIGCGNGRRLMDLSLYVRDLDAVGVDVRRCRLPSRTVPGVVLPQLSVFDGHTLDYAQNAFDIGMACYVLHHLDEAHARELVAEAMRVSRHRLLFLEDSRPHFSLAYRLRNWAHATEANLGYETESEHFRPNFEHTFKTHAQWTRFFSSFEGVASVDCVPLKSISKYAHHTLFVVELG